MAVIELRKFIEKYQWGEGLEKESLCNSDNHEEDESYDEGDPHRSGYES